MHPETQQIFDSRAARVVCHRRKGQTRATYLGVLCTSSMKSLMRSVYDYAGPSPTLERMDGAILIAKCEGYSRVEFMRGCPVGAWIVRPDQFDSTVQYCQLLAGMGIIRSVWLTSHADHAQAWLDRHS